MRVTNEILSHAGFKDFTVHASFLRDYHGRYFLKREDKTKRCGGRRDVYFRE